MERTTSQCSDATVVSARETGKYPCSVSHKGVGSNSIYCTIMVADIGFTRNAVILRIDGCEAVRIIDCAESAQVKMEFVTVHK